jgi:hypothetical protein
MEFLPAAYRAVQPGQNPMEPTATAPSRKEGIRSPPPSRTHHFEDLHFSRKWRMDLKAETAHGLFPAEWSTSSQMRDPRPNGRSIFDARFTHSPMGRLRSTGGGKMWDPRGVVSGADPMLAAEEMKDETAAAKRSAEIYKIENNQGLRNLDAAPEAGGSRAGYFA